MYGRKVTSPTNPYSFFLCCISFVAYFLCSYVVSVFYMNSYSLLSGARLYMWGLPEPYLWWVYQTGSLSTVFVHQSASCELQIWLVRLDWYSDLHAAICLPKCSGLDSPLAGIGNSRFLIAQIFDLNLYFKFQSDFRFLGYQSCRPSSSPQTPSIFHTGISCSLLINFHP